MYTYDYEICNKQDTNNQEEKNHICEDCNVRINLDETIDIVEILSLEAQLKLRDISSGNWEPTRTMLSPFVTELISSGIIIDAAPEKHEIGNTKEAELVALLEEENVPYDKKSLKAELAQICIEKIPEKAFERFGEATTVCIPEQFNARKIHNYLHRKYDAETFYDENMHLCQIPLLETELPEDDVTEQLIKRGYYSRNQYEDTISENFDSLQNGFGNFVASIDMEELIKETLSIYAETNEDMLSTCISINLMFLEAYHNWLFSE